MVVPSVQIRTRLDALMLGLKLFQALARQEKGQGLQKSNPSKELLHGLGCLTMLCNRNKQK